MRHKIKQPTPCVCSKLGMADKQLMLKQRLWALKHNLKMPTLHFTFLSATLCTVATVPSVRMLQVAKAHMKPGAPYV